MQNMVRISLLAQQKNPVFHARELAVLWDIKNQNTLYTILKRLTQKKILFRLFKGCYSLLPLEKVDPYLLGTKALHGYAYVSTETILSLEGIISQIIYDYTLISAKSLKFHINSHSYVSRKLQDKYLFNPIGIIEKNGVKMATPERAIADLLYFNPKYVLDRRKLISWDKVKALQKYIGYPLTPHFYAPSP